jgi:thioredoxin 1
MSYSTYKNICVNPDESDNNSFKVYDVQNLEDRNMIIKNYQFVVIKNYASWCNPCKLIAPKFAGMAKKYEEKGILLVKENHENKIRNRPTIKGLPCFHFYIGGEHMEEYTVTGANLEEVEIKLSQIIEKNI